MVVANASPVPNGKSVLLKKLGGARGLRVRVSDQQPQTCLPMPSGYYALVMSWSTQRISPECQPVHKDLAASTLSCQPKPVFRIDLQVPHYGK